jgi:hypothetical protein
LLGDDEKIAITTLEHRAEDGNGRETDVTLIIGANFLQGELHDVDEGPIKLKEINPPPSNAYTFMGTISINYDNLRIQLKGILTFFPGDSETVDTQFACKVLDP